MTERDAIIEARDAGYSWREIGQRFGKSAEAARNVYRRAKARIDPAISEAMQAANTNMVPSIAWVKTKAEDGTSYSVLLRPEQSTESLVDAMRAAFDGLTPAPTIPAPLTEAEDTLVLYPIADAHIGMLSWGQETGEDYDTDIAVRRLRGAVSQCVVASPEADTAIILNVGDFTHANDDSAATPKSKHSLDVDSRHFRTLDIAIQLTIDLVDMALAKHKHVIYRALPGNHDPATAPVLSFALAERYRDNPRVDIIKDPSEFFCYEFGKVMLVSHHGDKARADRLVLHMAEKWPEMWGRTRYRHYFTGHLHHHKAQDIGGVSWEQLRAVTAKDAYAASHAYSARSEMLAIAFHRTRGEVSRVRVNL